MSAADEAYKEAQRLIAEAWRAGVKELSFDGEATRALEVIPADIAGLTALTTLQLNNTQVSDLTPIAGLTTLTTLWLDGTQVSDLTPIAGLTALTTLQLNNAQVSDLTPIAGLIALTVLRLDNTQVSDLTPIAGLTALTLLWLDSTPVSDLTPIAGLTALTSLWLDSTPVSDLTPIAGLTALTALALNRTQVSDLTPIAGLTMLTALWLGNTPVSDMTPIAGLTVLTALRLDNTPIDDMRPVLRFRKLVDAPEYSGLSFRDCVAAKADPRIAEIAEIEDDKERAAALFAYIEDWVPPDTGTPPQPDVFLPVEIIDGKLEIAASLPSLAERDERLKRVLHERLVPTARDLAQAAGNLYPRLATKARALVLQADRPFEHLDMLGLYLEIADLSDRAERGQEDGTAYSPDVSAALGDVLRLGPGLTLDNADVELLLERTRRMREEPPGADEQAAQDAMSLAVIKDDAAIGVHLRTMEARLMEGMADATRAAVQKAMHRNLLWKITTWAVLGTTAFATGIVQNIVAANFGTEISNFVATNYPVLMQVAETYGAPFANWVFAQLHDIVGLAANIEIRPLPRRRDPK